MEIQLDLFGDDQQARVIADWKAYCVDGMEYWKGDASMVDMYQSDLEDGLEVIAIAFEKGPEATRDRMWKMANVIEQMARLSNGQMAQNPGIYVAENIHLMNT